MLSSTNRRISRRARGGSEVGPWSRISSKKRGWPAAHRANEGRGASGDEVDHRAATSSGLSPSSSISWTTPRRITSRRS